MSLTMRTLAVPVLFVISLLLLATPIFAQASAAQTETQLSTAPSGTQLSTGQIEDYANLISDRISNLTSGADQNMTPEEAAQKSVMVMGSGLGAAETAVMDKLSEMHPQLGQMARASDSQSLASLTDKYSISLLVGGPSQNAITAALEADGTAAFDNVSNAGDPLVIRQAEIGGKKIVIFSLLRGYDNEGRSNVANSPLSALIPQKYVPAAATVTTIGLMWLLPYILKLARMFGGKYAATKGKQGKKMRTEGIGFNIGHTHINLYELFSIFAAAAVFGIGIAWTFGAGKSSLLQFVGINIIAACLVFYGQSVLRIIIAHVVKMKTQFQFWLMGSGLTLLSAWLGNMAASPGYFVEEEVARSNDKRTEEQKERDVTKKSAWIRLGIIGVTAAFGLGFFIFNLLAPNKLLQVFMMSCTLNAACDMLPIKPMAGTVIKKWNWLVYVVLGLGVWALYLVVNFV